MVRGIADKISAPQSRDIERVRKYWDLHPTTKSINSSKSNNLPVWDRYFSQLSGPEYQSYKLSKENAAVKSSFDNIAKYHLNNSEIARELYCDGLTEENAR